MLDALVHRLGRLRRAGRAAAFLLLAGVPLGVASAAPVVLTDGNSSVTIDPTDALNHTDWLVDGVDQLAQQTFFYRIGNGPELNVNSLVVMGQASNANTLSVQYGLSEDFSFFSITMTYTLNGGGPGSGSSDLLVDIEIASHNEVPIDFHFWQYSDFDLNATALDTLVQASGSPGINTVSQSDSGVALQELVISSMPGAISHHEVGFFADTLIKLIDGDADTLNDVGGPLGPGDLTWALQWDFTLQPEDSFFITKDLLLTLTPPTIPSPSAAAFGLLGLALYRRFRR
jgi:hypothetical protein